MIEDMSSKRILTYRDLLPELEDMNDSASGSRAEWISEWFSGTDELGTLVTMAVSMLYFWPFKSASMTFQHVGAEGALLIIH
jgi:hypothetical protein